LKHHQLRLLLCCWKLIALATLSPTATAWSRKRFCEVYDAVDTAPESRDSSSSLFATFFYTQERKSKGRPSHQYHQCQARQQQTPNPRKPQEIRTSLEHLWNLGLLSAFPNSKDGSGHLWTLDTLGTACAPKAAKAASTSVSSLEHLGTLERDNEPSLFLTVSECNATC
jgi:hypothetical protein